MKGTFTILGVEARGLGVADGDHDGSGVVFIAIRKAEAMARKPTLKELQSGVGGGLIEVIPHFAEFEGKPCVAFCNEDGIEKGMPFNAAATELWLEQLGAGPFRYEPRLLGPVVILTGDKAFRD